MSSTKFFQWMMHWANQLTWIRKRNPRSNDWGLFFGLLNSLSQVLKCLTEIQRYLLSFWPRFKDTCWVAGGIWYSMKIKEQTRKLAAGCSKHRFEVVDKTDKVSHTYTARRSWRGIFIFEEYENKNTTLCRFTRCGCILSLRPSSLHKEK